jgi:hypothetical protein
MNRSLLKHASLCARNLLLSPSTYRSNPSLSLAPLAVSTLFRVGIHSFEPVSSNKSSLTQTQKIAFPNNVEDVSDEVKKLNLASVWLLGNPRKMKEREKKNYVNFRVF